MLYEFYGKECPHCIRMMTLTTRLMQEHPNIYIERKEVWHDKSNMDLIKQCDVNNECDGVPFYFDTETKKWLCGEVEYSELESWAGITKEKH